MNKKIITMLTVFFHFIIFAGFVYGGIKYCLSGKVVYQGIGMENVRVIGYEVNGHGDFKITKSDYDGTFYLYLPNGVYNFSVEKKGYLSKDLFKIIRIQDKNVLNVIFFLEKECKISGMVQFNDGTPIERACISVTNDRKDPPFEETDENGKYTVEGIGASENTQVKLIAPGIKPQIKSNIIISEGTHIEGVDFIIEKKVSISGKIIDENTQEPLTNKILVSINDGTEYFEALQNLEGEFTFFNLSPAKYFLIFFGEDYEQKVIEIMLSDSGLKNLIVKMKKKQI
jgi:hypothetical protein